MKKLKTVKNNLPFYVRSLSFLLAFFADIKCINWALVSGQFVNDGLMEPLYIGAISLIIIISFLAIRFKSKSEVKSSIIIISVLLLYYLITNVLVREPRVSLPFFSVFTISAFIIPQIVHIDIKWFLLTVMALPSFSIIRIDRIFASYLSWLDVISMDASYGYLIPIIANIIFVWFYFLNMGITIKIFSIIISAINIVFFMQLFLFGSRGPLLSIFMLIYFLFIVKVYRNKIVLNRIRIIVSLSIISICIISFISLVSYFNDFLSNIGVNSYAVQKIIDMDMDDNLSNGRFDLTIITWTEFWDKPLFGHGIDMFEYYHPDQPYPHNFILQILYDGGIVLFCTIIAPSIRRISIKLRRISKNEFAFMIFLFFSSVPGALLSQDVWENPILWLFFGYLFTNNIIYRDGKTDIGNYTNL